ncbi:MAG: type II toxin-antitoxin system Phd/YefM family antitoxin [Armatimonadetes bacterium]|nr:type II toxin-antitoxin system Phd/YefM family antitoxin [Armatimonadota bacterium]
MDISETRVSAADFKARCLALLDEVQASGRRLVVTKRGRPVAQVVPVAEPPAGMLAGSLLESDDLISPTGESWAAEA